MSTIPPNNQPALNVVNLLLNPRLDLANKKKKIGRKEIEYTKKTRYTLIYLEI